jgi:hypothetical protein
MGNHMVDVYFQPAAKRNVNGLQVPRMPSLSHRRGTAASAKLGDAVMAKSEVTTSSGKTLRARKVRRTQ